MAGASIRNATESLSEQTRSARPPGIRRQRPDAAGNRESNEIDLIPKAQLAHDVCPVRFRRPTADGQATGNVGAAVALTDEVEDFALTAGEGVVRVHRSALGSLQPHVHEMLRKGRAQVALPLQQPSGPPESARRSWPA